MGATVVGTQLDSGEKGESEKSWSGDRGGGLPTATSM